MIKKIVKLVYIVLFFIIGCSPQQNADKKDDGKASADKKIIIWHWMTDRKDAFEEIAKRYKQQKGVTVEFKLSFPPDVYSQKVIAAARAGTLPDIFGILGERKTLVSFIKAGHIVDLTSYMKDGGEEWKNRFYPKTLDTVIFLKDNLYEIPAGIYAVPIDTTVMQFVVNKSILKNADLDPEKYPQTFEEFLDYAKKIKEKTGINAFICGWGEGWLLNALATEWAINLMGEEKFLGTIAGKVPYTDEAWIRVFSLFKTLKDAGILVSNIATMTNKEAEDAFSKNKVAFAFNGSWAANVYKQLNPNLEYAFFSIPKVSSQFPAKIWGGAGSAFMVNKSSLRKEEAIQFLNWLTEKEQQQFLIETTNNIPAIKGFEDSIPPVLKSLLGELDMLTHPDTWPQNEDSRVIEVINRGLQQIVMGLKPPEEVAREIQEKKERILQK